MAGFHLLLPETDGQRIEGPRDDDRRVLNGIFLVLRTGTPWRDLPERYGPYTTIYNCFNRWPSGASGCAFRDARR
jgi:transposase